MIGSANLQVMNPFYQIENQGVDLSFIIYHSSLYYLSFIITFTFLI
jgi:hypothetical protein